MGEGGGGAYLGKNKHRPELGVQEWGQKGGPMIVQDV